MLTQLQNQLRTLPQSVQSTTNALNTMSAGTANFVSNGGRVSQVIQQISAQSVQLTGALSGLRSGIQTAASSTSQLNSAIAAGVGPLNNLANSLNQVKATSVGMASSLVVPFNASLAPIQQSGNALANLNGQLQQTGQQFNQTTTSGNRFAELFRGNRGLVFGASAFIGTLTGIGFELQLVDDANKQVSASMTKLNELTAQGKEGSQQYSQAQQALAKDQRFLEFSTRNLALAFTNLIPDTILITNGILSLREKMAANRAEQVALQATTRTTGVEFRTMGASAITAAPEITAVGAAGRGAGVGLTEAGVGARFFGISLRSALIGTGIGAALVAIGLLLEPIIQKFAESQQAANNTGQSFDLLGSITSGLGGLFGQTADKADSMNKKVGLSASDVAEQIAKSFGVGKDSITGFTDVHKEKADAIISNNKRISDSFANMNITPGGGTGQITAGPAPIWEFLAKSGQTVEQFTGHPAGQSQIQIKQGDIGSQILGFFGNIGSEVQKGVTQAFGGGQQQTAQKTLDLYKAESFWNAPYVGGFNMAEGDIYRAGGFPGYPASLMGPQRAGVFGPAAQSGMLSPLTLRGGAARPPYADILNLAPQQFYDLYGQYQTAGATAALQASLTGKISAGGITTGIAGTITPDQYAKAVGDLKTIGSFPADLKAAEGDEKAQQQVVENLISAYQDLQSIKKEISDTTKNEETKAAEEAKKAYQESQKQMDDYNTTLDKLPPILQDTGVFTKQLSDKEKERQAIIRESAAVYIGWTDSQKVSLGVAQQVAEQGNKLTAGLIQQRDAVLANNLIWDNMDRTVAGTNQTLGEWIQTQQEVTFAAVDVTKAITNQSYATYLANQGMLDGREAAKQFIDGAVQSGAASRQFGEDMMAAMDQIRVSGDLTLGEVLPEGIQLTNEEMKTLVATFYETGQVGQALADIVTSRMAPAFETLKGVIGADTRKDFNKAFKELDFGDLNKKAVSQFKDLDLTINKIQKQGTQMVDIISHLRVGLQMGFDFKNSTLRQALDEIAESIDKVVKLNPSLSGLTPLSSFLNDLSKEDRAIVIQSLGGALQTLFAKIQSGQATNYDVIAFWDEVNKIFGNTDQSAQGLKASLDDLKRSRDNFKQFQKKGTGLDTGMEIEDIVRGSGQPLIGLGGPAVPVKPPEDDKKGTDPKAAATQQQVAANNQLDRTMKQLIIDSNLLSKAESLLASVILNSYKDTISWIAGNNLLDRTFKQIIIDTNLWVKANNIFDSTVAQIITDVGLWVKQNNLLDRTFRQLIIDENIWVKQNNLFDSTVAQIIIDEGLWIKTNNILDKTVAQIIIDTNLWIKANNTLDVTVAQLITDIGIMIKTNNSYARTLLVVADDTDSAASSTDDFTSALSSLEKQAKATEKALLAEAAAAKKAADARSSGGGSSGGSGSGSNHQHGLHTTLNEDTLMFAHRGERVDIDTVAATESNRQMRARGESGETIINLNVTTVNELDGEVIGTTVTRKTFRSIKNR